MKFLRSYFIIFILFCNFYNCPRNSTYNPEELSDQEIPQNGTDHDDGNLYLSEKKIKASLSSATTKSVGK